MYEPEPETELETARLRLRRFVPADLDALAALHGDPAVMRYIDSRPPSREVVAEQTLPAILGAYAKLPEGLGHRVIEERDGGGFVGWVSLSPANSVGLAESDGIELGYRLRRESWGRGYATEVARAAVDCAFDRLGAQRIVAATMTVNAGSRRVLEKAGLRCLRTFFAQWPEYLEGAEHGDVVYGLTRAQWLSAARPAAPG